MSKKTLLKRGKRPVCLKNYKKNSPQLDTDVRHRAVKKKTVKKSTRISNYWHSIKSNA
jgi:hypothetical protein